MLIPSAMRGDRFLIVPVGIRDMPSSVVVSSACEGICMATVSRFVYVRGVTSAGAAVRQFSRVDGKEVGAFGLLLPATASLIEEWNTCRALIGGKAKQVSGESRLHAFRNRLIGILDAAEQEGSHGN